LVFLLALLIHFF